MVGPEEEKQGRSGGGDGGGVRPGKLQQEGGPGTAGAAGLKRKRTGGLVTLSEIHGDKLTAVANENWARGTGATTAAPEKFRPKLVSAIYRKELRSCMAIPGARAGPESSSRLQLLEISAYLENYLWPNFDPETSTTEHIMSAILLINSKFHEGVSVWEALGISEGRLGNLPMPVHTNAGNPSAEAVAASSVNGGSGGSKASGDGKSPAVATGGQRFAAFFESVLGLAMGDWPRVLERHEEVERREGCLAKGKLRDRGGSKRKGKGKGKGKARRRGGGTDQSDDLDAMEEEDDRGEKNEGETPSGGDRAAQDGEDVKEVDAQENVGEGKLEGGEDPPAKSPRTVAGGGSGKRGAKKGREPRRPGWEGLSLHERIAYVTFLVNVFQSLEEPVVRSNVLRLVYLPLWGALQPGRLALELKAFPQLKRHWLHLKAAANRSKDKTAMERYEWDFLPRLVRMFLSTVESYDGVGEDDEGKGVGTSAEGGSGAGGGGKSSGEAKAPPRKLLDFCERFMEFMIDLLCQLPTRRFLCVVLEDMRVLERCSLSALAAHSNSKLFRQLLDMFRFYLGFEINDQTGRPLTDKDMMERHYSRVHVLQKVVFEHYAKALPEFPFVSSVAAGKRDFLSKTLGSLAVETLKDLAQRMALIAKDTDDTSQGEEDNAAQRLCKDRSFLLEILLNHFADRDSQLQQVNELPLYPNETLLWDENLVPLGRYYGGKVMALPKLNLQFLTSHDYLLRSFNLFRLESAYEIRGDLVDSIRRSNPRRDPAQGGKTRFEGWARMATPISGVSISEVKKPNLGEKVPAQVLGEVSLNLAHFDRAHVRQEWDAFREHDVVFLISIQSPHDTEDTGILNLQQQWHQQAQHVQQHPNRQQPPPHGDGHLRRPNGGRVPGRMRRGHEGGRGAQVKDEEDPLFPARYGVVAVRGAEVYELADEDGNLLNDPAAEKERKNAPPVGNKRTLRLRLDPAQYHADMKAADMVYETVNLLVRRNAKENNFKGILETIRDLMNTSAVGQAMPPWLHDVFLGYGDPASANYRSMPEQQVLKDVDFGDTLLDVDHVREGFPGAAFKFADEAGNPLQPEEVSPPFRLSFSKPPAAASATTNEGAVRDDEEDIREDEEDSSPTSRELVTVTPYVLPNPGPYPQDVPKKNKVRFTPVQVEAIRSGMNPGLTMVVGPPGTGKTDVAVQAISNLYKLFPNQRTIMLAHSNAALNDLFEKISEKDIDERHLLRLGAGERELREGTMKDFSKFGRVNYTLRRRLELLAEVQRLAESIEVEGDVGYTCETAEYFQLFHVTSRIERFEAELEQRKATAAAAAAAAAGGAEAPSDGGAVKELFPFRNFFSNAPAGERLFEGKHLEKDLDTARGCFRHIGRMFEELADYRAFELLRSHSARSDYLLTKQARIIAMTCTHAALIRRRLVELGFKFDNMVMEESAQILEVETFIPMMLQDLDPVLGCRLKRVILIGDHHQLPPVVKSMAFQKYSKLDQSLFTRFVRLGTPTVQLNAQGRARPEIAALYNWRYKDLGNLPLVQAQPQYLTANPGFAYDYQLVDVPDFEGRGETTPTAFFYQNLGEAEYVVAVFQYMRLLGYPGEKISILTTYNGQCQLIEDVVRQRCSDNELFGEPGRIATVDKYQGQQNDYVLLSLVRTRTVGHLRDVRRLVVALSRARLGLYVFCRQSLFQDCLELAPAFMQMLRKPTKLRLVLNEAYPGGQRPASGGAGPPANSPLYEMRTVTDMGVLVHQMASAVMAHRAAMAHVAAQQAALQAAAREAAERMRKEGEAQAQADAAAAKREEDERKAAVAARKATARAEEEEEEEEEDIEDEDDEEEDIEDGDDEEEDIGDGDDGEEDIETGDGEEDTIEKGDEMEEDSEG